MKNIISMAIIAAIISTSCVSSKKFEEQTALSNRYMAEKEDCNQRLTETEEDLRVTKINLLAIDKEKYRLEKNVADLNLSKNSLSKLAKEEKELRLQTNIDYENHMKASSEKEESLTQALADKERKLTKKEANLAIVQTDLNKKEKELSTLKTSLATKEESLNILQSNLNEKSIKIEELQSKIALQNNAMLSLKNNVKKALKEFTSEDLTVTEKEGKIYVSLSENLLFKSGSFTLDEKGRKAIEKLAEVLAKQKDVDIIVEGHTDSDPFSGKGALLDNWDLSVKRATSVVRILEKKNVPKNKIVASGRADNIPLNKNKTKEEKAKNRRTEIILAPNLEHLMSILKSN